MTAQKVFIMSFTVNLYTLSKRDNSTKRPTGTGTQYNCIIKTGSGILHPTISLDLGKTNDPSQYNYAYIPNFDRYYFIEEWYFERALWTATLKVDVLATYKTEIGNANLYVMRCASEHDGSIIDTLYPAKTGCSFASDTKTNPWLSAMCYVVGVVSATATCGSLSHYAMLRGGFNTMCSNLLSSAEGTGAVTEANGFDWNDCSQALQRSLVDPLQYVKTCIALPLAIGDVPGSPGSPVTVYNWQAGVQGTVVAENQAITKTYNFTISKHPDTNSRGNYVNSAPFTNISLTIPPFGVFDIDTSVTCNASTLTATIIIDPVTGKASLTITCNGIVLNRVESQLGIPISMSSVKQDFIGAVSGLAGAVGGMAEGLLTGSLASGAIGVASGIGNAITSLVPRASTVGTTGSFGTLVGDFRLDHQFFRPISDDNTHNGRPLCAKRTLNTLSGYMIIQDGDVAINGTSREDAELRNYLETGFYYE